MPDYRELRTLQNQEIVSADRYHDPITATMTISQSDAALSGHVSSTFSPIQDLYLIGIKTMCLSSIAGSYLIYSLRKTSTATPSPDTVMENIWVYRDASYPGDRITSYDLGNKLSSGGVALPERIVSPLDTIFFSNTGGTVGTIKNATFQLYFVPYRSNIT